MKSQVLVINYHKIGLHPERKRPGDGLFCIDPKSFEQQIDVLVRKKIQVVTLGDISAKRLASPFSVAITIDDGNMSDYEVVYPKLRSQSLKATFFWLADTRLCQYARELYENGFEIGSHGLSHRDLTKLEPSEMRDELIESKKILEEKTGVPIHYFAAPFGLYNAAVLRASEEAGYRAFCTTDRRLNEGADTLLVHRWNIKRTTTLSEFEKLVSDHDALAGKIKRTQLKLFVKRILGRRLSTVLSSFFDF